MNYPSWKQWLLVICGNTSEISLRLPVLISMYLVCASSTTALCFMHCLIRFLSIKRKLLLTLHCDTVCVYAYKIVDALLPYKHQTHSSAHMLGDKAKHVPTHRDHRVLQSRSTALSTTMLLLCPTGTILRFILCLSLWECVKLLHTMVVAFGAVAL